VLTGCVDSVKQFTIAQGRSSVYKTTPDRSGMVWHDRNEGSMDTSANNELKKFPDKGYRQYVTRRETADSATHLTKRLALG